MNFDYWRQHAKNEQGQDVIDARRFIYQGDRAYAEDNLVAARDDYNKGLAAWRKVIDAHKEYLTEQTSREDLTDVIKRYRHLLGQLDERFPSKFILQDVIDETQKESGMPPPKPKEEKPKEKAAEPQKAGEKSGNPGKEVTSGRPIVGYALA